MGTVGIREKNTEVLFDLDSGEVYWAVAEYVPEEERMRTAEGFAFDQQLVQEKNTEAPFGLGSGTVD